MREVCSDRKAARGGKESPLDSAVAMKEKKMARRERGGEGDAPAPVKRRYLVGPLGREAAGGER